MATHETATPNILTEEQMLELGKAMAHDTYLVLCETETGRRTIREQLENQLKHKKQLKADYTIVVFHGYDEKTFSLSQVKLTHNAYLAYASGEVVDVTIRGIDYTANGRKSFNIGKFRISQKLDNAIPYATAKMQYRYQAVKALVKAIKHIERGALGWTDLGLKKYTPIIQSIYTEYGMNQKLSKDNAVNVAEYRKEALVTTDS